MGFSDNLTEMATDLAQSVAATSKRLAEAGVATSKRVAEIAKLSASNLAEEGGIKKAYVELGKLYYAEHGATPDAGYAAACEKIAAAKATIEANNERIAQLKAEAKAEGLYPLKSESGIDIMSINLLMERETDPVVWRGPVIAGAVKQFWTDVIWENEDFLFIDMPPGTGDVPLTIYQSIPISGIVIVTSPQALVSMVVTKAVKMAEMMNIPVLGIVENMAFFKCPDCGGEHQIYGKSHVAEIAEAYRLEVLARIPIDPRIAEACDEGLIESLGGEWMDALAQGLLEGVKRQEESNFIRIAVPVTEGDVIAADFLKASCFKFYNVENGKLDSSVCVDPAGSGQDAIVKFLKMYGVNVAICGSVENETVAKLQEADVWVVSGLEGKADEKVDAFLAGQIEGTFGSGCGGNCGHHHDDDEASDQ